MDSCLCLQQHLFLFVLDQFNTGRLIYAHAKAMIDKLIFGLSTGHARAGGMLHGNTTAVSPGSRKYEMLRSRPVAPCYMVATWLK